MPWAPSSMPWIDSSSASCATNTLPSVLTDPKVAGPLMMSVWQRAAVMADKYNEPGKFTTLIGFEWTPTPGGDNLHRNVLFRDGKVQATHIGMATKTQISQLIDKGIA